MLDLKSEIEAISIPFQNLPANLYVRSTVYFVEEQIGPFRRLLHRCSEAENVRFRAADEAKGVKVYHPPERLTEEKILNTSSLSLDDKEVKDANS